MLYRLLVRPLWTLMNVCLIGLRGALVVLAKIVWDKSRDAGFFVTTIIGRGNDHNDNIVK